ncbi:class I SAM-dependent methyltransferase [Candidatus Neomarinimicrobiota bacterium]
MSIKSQLKRIYYKKYGKETNDLIHELASSHENSHFMREYMLSNYPRVRKDAKIVRKYTNKNSTILDIGASPPLLTALLKQTGRDHLTVIDPYASKFLNYLHINNIQYFDNDLLEGDINSIGEYDFVCLCEVIEHLPSDIPEIIQRITLHVRIGGILFLTTPNLRSISGFLALLLNGSSLASKPTEGLVEQYRKKNELGYYGHLREYTAREVVDICESVGLQHVKTILQPDYRLHPRSKVAGIFETLIPPLRLMAKYLFRRVE